MKPIRDAAAHLRLADIVRKEARLEPIADVAQRMGLTRPMAEKMRWLSGAYSPAAREAIGKAALAVLSPSHLEVAAQAGEREWLLRRAAEERMSVRQLRTLVERPCGQSAGTVIVTGGARDLDSARHSLARYMGGCPEFRGTSVAAR